MSVPCECCVLYGRGLYDGPVTRPEECVLLSVISSDPDADEDFWPARAVEPWKNNYSYLEILLCCLNFCLTIGGFQILISD